MCAVVTQPQVKQGLNVQFDDLVTKVEVVLSQERRDKTAPDTATTLLNGIRVCRASATCSGLGEPREF